MVEMRNRQADDPDSFRGREVKPKDLKIAWNLRSFYGNDVM
jgi:hypothetical protein